MVFSSKFAPILGVLVFTFLSVGHVRASAVTTYTGTLTGDDQTQEYTWTLAQSSDVVLSTDSYGGGTMNGITTPAGGFVPVISIFNAATGALIASDGADGTCMAGMTKDSATHMCDDAYLSLKLKAGSYILALGEFFNVPVGPNLSNGFLEQGQGNFTASTCGTSGSFWETDVAPCVQRDSSFTLNAAAVPEPATLWIALPIFALGLIRRKRG
ncbi:MAG: DVUA0089 family protein [Acidobacteriaceae bacterium]|nr:DVUA0089 family protein [Acidobacteriaceae bacterium]